MREATRIDPDEETIGIDRTFAAAPRAGADGHDSPFDGLVFGVARMSRSAPHNGERHPDGDEVLYLVSGHARLVFTDDPLPDVDLQAGDTVIVPKGLWHRVEILEPSHIVYLTPSRDNEVRPLD